MQITQNYVSCCLGPFRMMQPNITIIVNVECSYAFQNSLSIAALWRKSDIIQINRVKFQSMKKKNVFTFFLHFVLTVFIFLQVSF